MAQRRFTGSKMSRAGSWGSGAGSPEWRRGAEGRDGLGVDSLAVCGMGENSTTTREQPVQSKLAPRQNSSRLQ